VVFHAPGSKFGFSTSLFLNLVEFGIAIADFPHSNRSLFRSPEGEIRADFFSGLVAGPLNFAA
jgi:hypothetical protein